MIEVQLQPDTRVQFSSRALVWVWGTLRSFGGHPEEAKPLYRLEGARVQRTEENSIAKYFR